MWGTATKTKDVTVTVVYRGSGQVDLFDAPALAADGRTETFPPGIILETGDTLAVETRRIPA